MFEGGDAFLIYSSFQGLMSQGSGVRNCRSRFWPCPCIAPSALLNLPERRKAEKRWESSKAVRANQKFRGFYCQKKYYCQYFETDHDGYYESNYVRKLKVFRRSVSLSNCVILKGMSHAGVIFLFCADQTPWLNAAEGVHQCVFSLLWVVTFQIKADLWNNYPPQSF